jgi:hypothetical protein
MVYHRFCLTDRFEDEHSLLVLIHLKPNTKKHFPSRLIIPAAFFLLFAPLSLALDWLRKPTSFTSSFFFSPFLKEEVKEVGLHFFFLVSQ